MKKKLSILFIYSLVLFSCVSNKKNITKPAHIFGFKPAEKILISKIHTSQVEDDDEINLLDEPAEGVFIVYNTVNDTINVEIHFPTGDGYVIDKYKGILVETKSASNWGEGTLAYNFEFYDEPCSKLIFYVNQFEVLALKIKNFNLNNITFYSSFR